MVVSLCSPLPFQVKTIQAQPFLKWAGGKRKLLPVLKQFIPQEISAYYEPFVGAGALLFELQPDYAVINDSNPELINCYRVIRDNPAGLLASCADHQRRNSKEYYYHIRALDRTNHWSALSPVARAARILYLNKTCFNGLFRVNNKGQFNVPYGNYKSPTVADANVIYAVSAYLNTAKVKIYHGDFITPLSGAKPGAFIYFDPPYHPISKTSSFTSYSKDDFGEAEQVRLRDLCNDLHDQGCKILLSNSSADLIKKLYSDRRYTIIEVDAARSINVVGSKRGKIKELLIHNNYR
jgi:DNA adenine methylase